MHVKVKDCPLNNNNIHCMKLASKLAGYVVHVEALTFSVFLSLFVEILGVNQDYSI